MQAGNIQAFLAELNALIAEKGYTLDQVYNWDEAGLNWKMPAGTFISKEEKQGTGFKVVKDRFTVMMCCNATGMHRLPLLIVYKSCRPHCYRHQNLSKLDVYACICTAYSFIISCILGVIGRKKVTSLKSSRIH